MRFYLILLTEISSFDNDKKFFNQVIKNKWEWWRYYPTSFILATPKNVYTNQLVAMAVEAYGPQLITVMEIGIKDVGGIIPGKKDDLKNGITPLTWFYQIQDPKYVPKWERDTEDIPDKDFE